MKFAAQIEARLKEAEAERQELKIANEAMAAKIQAYESEVAFINENGVNIELTVRKGSPGWGPQDPPKDRGHRLSFNRPNSSMLPRQPMTAASSADIFFNEFQGVSCISQAVTQAQLIEKIIKDDAK